MKTNGKQRDPLPKEVRERVTREAVAHVRRTNMPGFEISQETAEMLVLLKIMQEEYDELRRLYEEIKNGKKEQ